MNIFQVTKQHSMNENITVSNRSIFQAYAILRIIAIAIILAFVLLPFSDNPTTVIIIKSLSISVLLTILLFDFLQKPSFIEVTRANTVITLSQYTPDPRHIFYLASHKIKTVKLNDSDRASFKIHRGILSLFDQIEFQIDRHQGGSFKTKKINAAWLSDKEIRQLEDIFQLK